LTAANGTNVWAINAINAGNINSSAYTFSGFGNLTGNGGVAGSDTFNFSATGAVTGNITGAAAGTETLDYTGLTGTPTENVTLTAIGSNHGYNGTAGLIVQFSNIDVINDTVSASNTLTGANLATTYTLSGANVTAEEKSAALELLRDPHLLQRIVADFERCGVVGEETNKLVGYVATVSRHLESPLAVIVQSSSAAGKSSLMEAVLAFLPDEQRVQYSAMTGHRCFTWASPISRTKYWPSWKKKERSAPPMRSSCCNRKACSPSPRLARRYHGTADYASVPCRRTGDDLPHHDSNRLGRRAVEPLSGADGERGPRANTGYPSQAAGAQTLEGLLARMNAKRSSSCIAMHSGCSSRSSWLTPTPAS